MFTGLRTAVIYFGLGLVAGVLLAPRTGDETRAMLMARAREEIRNRSSPTGKAAGDLDDPAGDPAGDGPAPEAAGASEASSSSTD